MVMRCNFFPFFLIHSSSLSRLLPVLPLLSFHPPPKKKRKHSLHKKSEKQGERMSKIGTFHHAIVFNELKLKNCVVSRLLRLLRILFLISHPCYYTGALEWVKRHSIERWSLAQIPKASHTQLLTQRHEDLYFINIFSFCFSGNFSPHCRFCSTMEQTQQCRIQPTTKLKFHRRTIFPWSSSSSKKLKFEGRHGELLMPAEEHKERTRRMGEIVCAGISKAHNHSVECHWRW